MNKEELQKQLEEKGINYSKRWGIKKLEEALSLQEVDKKLEEVLEEVEKEVEGKTFVKEFVNELGQTVTKTYDEKGSVIKKEIK